MDHDISLSLSLSRSIDRSIESSSFYRVWVQKCRPFPLTFLFLLFEKQFNCFFDIQPEEGSCIRAETSYPNFWVAGDEGELWKTMIVERCTAKPTQQSRWFLFWTTSSHLETAVLPLVNEQTQELKSSSSSKMCPARRLHWQNLRKKETYPCYHIAFSELHAVQPCLLPVQPSKFRGKRKNPGEPSMKDVDWVESRRRRYRSIDS